MGAEFGSFFLGDQLAKLRQALEELGKAVGPRYSANLSVIVDIADRENHKGSCQTTTQFVFHTT